MSTLLALVLMQYVVSVKAGLVNHVQGNANVVEMEMVRPGHSITTADNGYVEVLLTPGSFLRVGENSAVVLDGVELEKVSLRVTKGPAVIEVIDISKDYPIKVTTGNLTMDIVAAGIYRFQDGTATVLDGKLQTPGTKLSYGKGWQVFFQDNYRARKTGKIQVTSLDVYSQSRSQKIASANITVTSQLNASYGNYPYWLYAPYMGFYTFVPFGRHRSPYGYDYYGIGSRKVVVRGNYSSPSNNSSGGGGGLSQADPRPSNSGGDSGGGGAGGGGAAPVTVSTPSGERSTPAVYIESKSAPVGATQ